MFPSVYHLLYSGICQNTSIRSIMSKGTHPIVVVRGKTHAFAPFKTNGGMRKKRAADVSTHCRTATTGPERGRTDTAGPALPERRRRSHPVWAQGSAWLSMSFSMSLGSPSNAAKPERSIVLRRGRARAECRMHSKKGGTTGLRGSVGPHFTGVGDTKPRRNRSSV